MKRTTSPNFSFKKAVLCFAVVILLVTNTVDARNSWAPSSCIDLSVNTNAAEIVIQRNIISLSNELFYPNSVARFYKQSGYRLAWLAPDTVKMHAYDAMLLLDCISQYGLSHTDYHPDQLLYDDLNNMTQQFELFGEDQKARFDILLTDAMLRFINDLHYGKLNREHSAKINDTYSRAPFQAVEVLSRACRDQNFITVIESVQPKSVEYAALKHWMYLVKGVYTGDNYETAQSTVRQVAINMNRLRWAGDDENAYIHINIPSYSLKFHQKGKDYNYRVQVGKKTKPTPQVKSQVTSIGMMTTPVTLPVLQLSGEMPVALGNGGQLNMPSIEIFDFKGNSLEATSANLRLAQQNPSKYIIKRNFAYTPEQTRLYFRLYPFMAIGISDAIENANSPRQRMTTEGDIKVEKAERLVYNILKQNGSRQELSLFRKTYNSKGSQNIRLAKPIPIRVTYITCAIKDGVLEVYKDIYGLDDALARAFYPANAKK